MYLCPMRDGGGTRLKILDALAMGVPIVATQMALEGIDVVPEKRRARRQRHRESS